MNKLIYFFILINCISAFSQEKNIENKYCGLEKEKHELAYKKIELKKQSQLDELKEDQLINELVVNKLSDKLSVSYMNLITNYVTKYPVETAGLNLRNDRELISTINDYLLGDLLLSETKQFIDKEANIEGYRYWGDKLHVNNPLIPGKMVAFEYSFSNMGDSLNNGKVIFTVYVNRTPGDNYQEETRNLVISSFDGEVKFTITDSFRIKMLKQKLKKQIVTKEEFLISRLSLTCRKLFFPDYTSPDTQRRTLRLSNLFTR